MFNRTLYESLPELSENLEQIVEAHLINLESDEIVFRFLLVPEQIVITANNEYIEKNALFSKRPYVRFRSSKAARLTLNNVRLVTPCGRKSLTGIIPVLDMLRYPNNLIINSADLEEIELEELEDFDDLQAIQFSSNVPTFPNQREELETIDLDPTELPGSEIEPVVTDEEQFIPATRYLINDPPRLGLVYGSRVIQPLAIESYTSEENMFSSTGDVIDATLTINFIALDSPII